jgi:hypothetical protein
MADDSCVKKRRFAKSGAWTNWVNHVAYRTSAARAKRSLPVLDGAEHKGARARRLSHKMDARNHSRRPAQAVEMPLGRPLLDTSAAPQL